MTKWQPTNWEKIFTNPTSDRGLVSNIYKEFKKLDPRESNNLIKKWGTDLNKEFSPEEIWMAEKHLKKCLTSSNANLNNPEISPHTSQNG